MIIIDIQAEKQAIKEMVRNGMEVENQKDFEALMGLNYYDENVIVQGPNMPQFKGLDALQNFYKEYIKTLDSIEGGSTEVHISEAGDLAWDYGWNRAVYKGPDGPIEDEGKYLQVMKKINGKWKCVAISFTSNKPVI